MNTDFTTHRGTGALRVKALRSRIKLRVHLGASVTLCVVLVVASVAPTWAQTTGASKTREHVQTLASERFGGREAGSEGERLAGDYIVAQLARVGAKALPGKPDMFQAFTFTA